MAVTHVKIQGIALVDITQGGSYTNDGTIATVVGKHVLARPISANSADVLVTDSTALNPHAVYDGTADWFVTGSKGGEYYEYSDEVTYKVASYMIQGVRDV